MTATELANRVAKLMNEPSLPEDFAKEQVLLADVPISVWFEALAAAVHDKRELERLLDMDPA